MTEIHIVQGDRCGEIASMEIRSSYPTTYISPNGWGNKYNKNICTKCSKLIDKKLKEVINNG